MNLETTYLGMKLPHPIMSGASPFVDDLDTVRRLEDAGVAAIVMHSLFEEQIALEQMAAVRHLDGPNDSFSEAANFLPSTDVFALGPDRYLEQLRRIRESVSCPVIASLNGTTRGGWLEYAKRMEEAGAHALELNLYAVETDPNVSAADIENRQIEIIKAVVSSVSIPVSVKLSPFYTSIAHFVNRIEATGAKGVVLFNRFYQPDLDLENLEMSRRMILSDSSELPLRLRWLAILSPRTQMSLGASGGVHCGADVLKSVMCGAEGVQVVAALMRHGPEFIRVLVEGVARWLEEFEYKSLAQAHDSMNFARSPDPSAYERANYIQILQSWHGKAPYGPGHEMW